MSLGPIAQIAAFSIFAFISIAGAVGMTTTMSMFRSGIFLMASFIGVAGLFILLLADLLGMLQIMMYIGGMLVMILYMVLFAGDPGGNMMAKMQMPFLEKLFSMGLLPKKDLKEHNHGNKEEHDHNGMDMNMDMSMFTSIKPYAAIIGIITGVLLIGTILIFPDWIVIHELPDPDSARRIGNLLMGKYMMAFEGAGLMILLGIFGAIYFARTKTHPDSKDRSELSKKDDDPPEIEDDTIHPYFNIDIDAIKEKAGED